MGCHHLLDDVVILMNNINLVVLGVHIDVLEFGGSPFSCHVDFVERHLGSAWVSEGLFLLRVGSSSAGSDLKAHDQSHDHF